MKSTFWKVVSLSWLTLLATSFLQAGELDLLVQELVAKGVLDPGRAQEILTLTEEQMRKEIAKGEVSTLPTWLQKMNIKGDLRLRNQWEKMETDTLARMRQRIRFRLNGEADVSHSVKVAYGLATGGTDPRSTNQTLENSFETKSIMLDYAYVQYVLPRYLTLIGGKFYNNQAIWSASDYLWDGDITLEGAAGLVKYRQFFANVGLYFLDEMGKVKDVIKDNPRLFLVQPGMTFAREEAFDWKIAATYYRFANVKDKAFDHAKWSNSFYTVGTKKYLANGYNNLALATGFSAYDKLFPYVGLSAEYNVNLEADSAKSGLALSVAFGHKKISARGQWQVKYQYRKLERDTWLDFLPDSDTYTGKTDVQGNKLSIQYGLSPKVIAGINYFNNENLSGTIVPETLVQLDLQFKF